MQQTLLEQTLPFQALGDVCRLRIMRLLIQTGAEACLCELVDSLLEPKSKLSRHLKILRQAGLLQARKEGRWLFHRLPATTPPRSAFFQAVDTLPDPRGIYAADRQRFVQRLAQRQHGCGCTNSPPESGA